VYLTYTFDGVLFLPSFFLLLLLPPPPFVFFLLLHLFFSSLHTLPSLYFLFAPVVSSIQVESVNPRALEPSKIYVFVSHYA